jgi:poly(3-hydroxybutyrate) depolymerase
MEISGFAINTGRVDWIDNDQAGRMMYEVYQTYFDLMVSMRLFTQATLSANAAPWLIEQPGMPDLAGACEVLSSIGVTCNRPGFRLTSVRIGDGNNAREVAVYEEAAHVASFGTLLHFRKEGVTGQPRVLIVAPMSGHFPSRLRENVRVMLADHDVYITDWHNARDVPLAAGRFGLDEYARHLMTFLTVMGPGAHTVAICQSCVPALAATALLAEDNHPAQPHSLTLIAGPVDTRVNPTRLGKFAASVPIKWFHRNLISVVPLCHAGARRRVYPGFLQLATFMSMNHQRHLDFFTGLYSNLVKGDLERARAMCAAYQDDFMVMDLAAEFYLETIRHVFQEHALPLGKLKCSGRIVHPAAIRRTALLTVEAERDDTCAIGQTLAAHRLCTGMPRDMKSHHMEAGVGHDDILRGQCWRNRIYPVVREMIRVNH